MIYIVTTETFPYGLAATQRLKCYAKCLASLGAQCQVICLNRCEDQSNPLGNVETFGTIDGYSYKYLGPSTCKSDNNLINKIHQFTDTVRFVFFMLHYVTGADKILFYSYNTVLMDIVQLIAKLKKVETYYELNEHPSIQIKGFEMNDNEQEDRLKLLNRLKGFNNILCISYGLRELLRNCGFAETRLHVINMVVDQNRFSNIIKKQSEKYIAYCGAADNNKDGVDQLIKAFSIVAKKHEDVKLYVMGPKRSDCNNEQLARSLGIGDRVVFTGMISSDEMPQKLMDATVLALDRPSGRQAKYGFPTKLGEYLATGNPVVITSVGDIPLYLKDGVSAFIAQPDSCNSFASKLDLALCDNELSSFVGKQGKIVASMCFSETKIKEQLKNAMHLRFVDK